MVVFVNALDTGRDVWYPNGILNFSELSHEPRDDFRCKA